MILSHKNRFCFQFYAYVEKQQLKFRVLPC